MTSTLAPEPRWSLDMPAHRELSLAWNPSSSGLLVWPSEKAARLQRTLFLISLDAESNCQ